MALSAWMIEASRTYIGNASSRRDFRVQMRGTKPFWIFAAYVFSLCVIGFMMYASILGNETLSLSTAQSQLNGLFNSLMGVLAAAICVIAPALSATAIVAERERQSLDLVLTAPVEPKYLLVGKMISSYRYTWMMLILALPVVAMSVVLGGATWHDVFGCFLLLSFHAMIFTSLALLISSLVNKPSSAVVWSIFGVIGYNVVAYILSSAPNRPFMMGGPSTHHAPFTVALSPFTALEAINTTTQVGSIEVPNWVFGGLFTLLVTRLFLLAAAVTLAPLDRRLAANLRLTGIVYTFGLGWLVMYAVGPVFLNPYNPINGMQPRPSLSADLQLTNVALAVSAWLALGMPALACYGRDGSRRFFPNGLFALRNALDGTPAGALPYALTLLVAAFVGVLVGNHFSVGETADAGLVPGVAFGVGLTIFLWAIGRWLSAKLPSIKAARGLHVTAIVSIFFGLPTVLSMLQLAPSWASTGNDYGQRTTSLWYLWPLSPLTSVDLYGTAPIYAGALLLLGLGIAIRAERAEKVRTRRLKLAQSN